MNSARRTAPRLRLSAGQSEEDKKDKAEEKRVDGLKDKEDADSDTVTVTASSWEELLQKINETVGNNSSGSVRTKEETWVGQQFDYTI